MGLFQALLYIATALTEIFSHTGWLKYSTIQVQYSTVLILVSAVHCLSPDPLWGQDDKSLHCPAPSPASARILSTREAVSECLSWMWINNNNNGLYFHNECEFSQRWMWIPWHSYFLMNITESKSWCSVYVRLWFCIRGRSPPSSFTLSAATLVPTDSGILLPSLDQDTFSLSSCWARAWALGIRILLVVWSRRFSITFHSKLVRVLTMLSWLHVVW